MYGQDSTSFSRFFWRLALATTLLTLGLVVFGAVVRVTDSGLGCGDHWPLCNGTIFPPLDNLTAWIEWMHRLFALLIGVLGIAMLVVALRNYRSNNRLALAMTITGAVLYFLQSALGAIVVFLELPPTMVTLHLGTAMLLLGALLMAAIFSRFRPESAYPRDYVTLLAYLTTALALVIMLIGALVRSSDATLACTDWPLCNGDIIPFSQGELASLHFTHRLAVLTLGISLALLNWFVYRERENPLVRRLALWAIVAYFAQAGVGALFVLSRAEGAWGALHVGLAATTWALLVALSTVEYLNTRTTSQAQQGESWAQASEPTPN